jgi:hypothetical protein
MGEGWLNVLFGASLILRLKSYLPYETKVVAKSGLAHKNTADIKILVERFKRIIGGVKKVRLFYSPLFNSFQPGRGKNGHYPLRDPLLPKTDPINRPYNVTKMKNETLKLIKILISTCDKNTEIKVYILPTLGRRQFKCRAKCSLCIHYMTFYRKVQKLYYQLTMACTENIVCIQYRQWVNFHIKFATRKCKKRNAYLNKILLAGQLSSAKYDMKIITYLCRSSTNCAGCFQTNKGQFVLKNNPLQHGSVRIFRVDHTHWCCELAIKRYVAFLINIFDPEYAQQLALSIKYDPRLCPNSK